MLTGQRHHDAAPIVQKTPAVADSAKEQDTECFVLNYFTERSKEALMEPPKERWKMWQWYLSGSSWLCFAPLTRNQSPRNAIRASLSEYDKRPAHGTVCIHASAFVSDHSHACGTGPQSGAAAARAR